MGIDLSLVETGIVCLEDGKIIFQDTVKSKPKEGQLEIERIRAIALEVNVNGIGKYKPSLVVIEGLSYGSKNTTSLCQLAKLNFCIEIYCYIEKYRYLMVPPTSLKKFITGKGSADKSLMGAVAKQRWSRTFRDDNECDAFCLLMWALAGCPESAKTPKKRRAGKAGEPAITGETSLFN